MVITVKEIKKINQTKTNKLNEEWEKTSNNKHGAPKINNSNE